jgi:hypothetical protein
MGNIRNIPLEFDLFCEGDDAKRILKSDIPAHEKLNKLQKIIDEETAKQLAQALTRKRNGSPRTS